MALVSVTCTKMFPDANHVGIHIVLEDDDRPDLGTGNQVVIDTVIKRQFESGNNLDLQMRDSLKKEAQDIINCYKVLRNLYDDPVYGNGISHIEGALTL